MKLDQNQLTDLLLQFAQDYCQKNNIDFSQVEDGIAYSNDTAKVILPVVPNGNMACIFDEVNIEFALRNDDITMYSAVVRFSYSHAHGGSNGYSIDYIVLTRPSVTKVNPEYVGHITDPEIQVVLRHVNSLKGE